MATTVDYEAQMPLEKDSGALIKKDAPKALAYLERTGNTDVAEALGLTKYV